MKDLIKHLSKAQNENFIKLLKHFYGRDEGMMLISIYIQKIYITLSFISVKSKGNIQLSLYISGVQSANPSLDANKRMLLTVPRFRFFDYSDPVSRFRFDGNMMNREYAFGSPMNFRFRSRKKRSG